MRLRPFIHTTILAAFTLLANASAEDSLSLLGTWKSTGDLPDGGTNESTVTITKEGDAYKGTAVGEDGKERNIDRFKVEGLDVTMELDIESNGETGVLRIKAKQTAIGKLAGKWYLIDSAGEERADAAWESVRISEPKPKIAVASIVGKWDATASTDNGELPSVVVFTEKDGKFAGTSTSDRGENTFDSVKVDGKDVEIEMTLELDDNEIDVRIEAALKTDDHLDGKWVIFDGTGQEAATGKWEAKRALSLDLTGTWDIVANTEQEDNEHQAIFEKKGASFKGHVSTDDGDTDIKVIDVEGNDVELELPFGDGTVKIAASYKETDKLTGKWTYFDSSDVDVATGAWTATRQAAKEESTAPSVVGEWALDVSFGDLERKYGFRFSEEGDALKGVLVHPEKGDLACDSVSFVDGELNIAITREVQGSDVEFIYEGKLAEDDSITGTVVPKGYEDQFSGEFTAKRK